MYDICLIFFPGPAGMSDTDLREFDSHALNTGAYYGYGTYAGWPDLYRLTAVIVGEDEERVARMREWMARHMPEATVETVIEEPAESMTLLAIAGRFDPDEMRVFCHGSRAWHVRFAMPKTVRARKIYGVSDERDAPLFDFRQLAEVGMERLRVLQPAIVARIRVGLIRRLEGRRLAGRAWMDA